MLALLLFARLVILPKQVLSCAPPAATLMQADKAQCMMNSPSSQYELFVLRRQQLVVATLEKKLRAMKVVHS